MKALMVLLLLFLFTSCSYEISDESTTIETDMDCSASEETVSQETTYTDYKDEFLTTIISEMEDKGWKDVTATEGVMDDHISEYTGLRLERDDKDKNMNIQSVYGWIDGMYKNPIIACVEVVFDDESRAGEIHRLFYVSSSGRLMEFDASDEILRSSDDDLWNYMYSY